MKSFADLFKKYRLRAEFETFAAFGAALSEKGYFYEDSIFSHWQKGTRTPSNRQIVIAVISIFLDKKAMHTREEANEFIASAGLGFLTEDEIDKLPFIESFYAPFQVPSEIAHFTGREDVIEKVKNQLTNGKILLLHGPAGVGKTAIAIKLGHILKENFPDGVLWYKVDSSNIMDILLSIARLFGEDISGIKDIEVRASIVRTLLEKKKILLIFDNVVINESIYLLIPNSPHSSIIFSSQESSIAIPTEYLSIYVDTFTNKEAMVLFEIIFSKAFVKAHRRQIMEVCEKLGNLPLALQMVANYLKQYPVPLNSYIKQLDDEPIDLQQMTYEDKNLLRAITISYTTLSHETKNVFISLSVFEGKDFSLESVSFINNLSEKVTKQLIEKLQDISFVEASTNNRYRIHPLIKIYARKHLSDPSIYSKAAQYYEQLLVKVNDKQSFRTLRLEVDNILYIFKKCYEKGYWDEMITLWNPMKTFLSDTNEIKKLGALTQTIDTAPNINNLQKIFTGYFLLILIYWVVIYTSGLKTDFWNYMYSFAFGLIPLIGGFVGIIRSKHWRLFQSNIGKAIFFISAGLFSWGCGSMVWVYYNLSKAVAVPYPSFADVGYFPAYFFWIAGVFFLSRATGAKLNVNQIRSNMFFLIIPFLLILFSWYFLFFMVQREFVLQTPLRIFFDLYYPTMNIIIVSLAISIFGLSINFFGGKYRLSIYAILLGFLFQYFGDFIFSYTTSQNTYFNGNLADLCFTIALYLLTWGTLSFYLTPKKSIIND